MQVQVVFLGWTLGDSVDVVEVVDVARLLLGAEVEW